MTKKTFSCLQCGVEFSRHECDSNRGQIRFCSRKCVGASRGAAHGHARDNKHTPTYNSWSMMISRCTNPKAPNYPRYGGAGISVCPEWRRSFLAFLRDMGERPEGKTLDRIEGATVYGPGTCKWSTPAEQQRNIKSNVFHEFNGERLCITDWAKRAGVNSGTMWRRIQAWGIERAVTTPPIRRGQQRT